MCATADVMRIPLTHGQIALVDAKDYIRLSQWKWYAHFHPDTGRFYAQRNIRIGGQKTVISMHREIMGLKRGDLMTVDHIQSERTLDNRRVNLRFATPLQQTYNRGKQKNNTSGFKGVFRRIGRNGSQTGWFAQIRANRKQIYLGCADSPEGAAELYAKAVGNLHGEFAKRG